MLQASEDPIIAIAVSASCLLVARDSGALLKYSLPHIGTPLRYRPVLAPTHPPKRKGSVIVIPNPKHIYKLIILGSQKYALLADRGEPTC